MKNFVKIPILLALVTLALTACGLLQEPEEASGTIEAIPLEVATSMPEVEPVEEAPVEEPTEVMAEEPAAYPAPEEPATTPDTEDAAYPAPEEAESSSSESEAYPAPEAEAEAPASVLRIYEISQEDSQVRFELNEELRGQPKTVVGVTDQVAGEMAVNLSDLASTQVGVIRINARTLATDNNFRNRAIQNEILDTGAHEFITFTPTSVDGLPASAAVGEEVAFTISGDLTIRDITQPVIFNVTATAVSEGELAGTASAVVLRADFGLEIPSVPNVANVEEEVELYIDFVAFED
ncbi:MAG: YceI family protein [Chloroflexota bacterium]|nr:MAG: YceI family protein [Chloroflexota bacterium]